MFLRRPVVKSPSFWEARTPASVPAAVDAGSRAGARDAVTVTLANESSVDDSEPPLVHTIASARTVQLSALAPTARGEMRIVAVEHASDRLHYWMYSHQYTLRRLELDEAAAVNETAAAAAAAAPLGSRVEEHEEGAFDLRWAPVALFRKSFALRHRLDPRASAPSEVPLIAVAAAASDVSATSSAVDGEANAAAAESSPAPRVDAAVLCIYPYITSLNRSQYSGALEVLNLPAAAAGFSAALLSPDGMRLALVDLTDELLLLRATGGSSRADTSSSSSSSNEWEISHELTAPRALGKRRLLAMRMVDVTVSVPVSDSRRRPTSPSTSSSSPSQPADAHHSSFLSSLFDPLNFQAGNVHVSLGLFSPLGLLFNRHHNGAGSSPHRDREHVESEQRYREEESVQQSAAGGESRARTVTKKLTFLCMYFHIVCDPCLFLALQPLFDSNCFDTCCLCLASTVGVHTGGRLISYDLSPSGRSRLPFALAPHVTYAASAAPASAAAAAATPSPSDAASSGADARGGGAWSALYRGEAGLAAGASRRDRRASKAADDSAPDEAEVEALYAARQSGRVHDRAGSHDRDREDEVYGVGPASGRPQRSARAADHSLDDLEPWLIDMLVAIDDMGVNFEYVALAVLLGSYFCVLACMRASRARGAVVDYGPVAPVNVVHAANVVAAPAAAAAAAVVAPGNLGAAANGDAAPAAPAAPVSAAPDSVGESSGPDSAAALALGDAESAPLPAPDEVVEASASAAPLPAPQHQDA